MGFSTPTRRSQAFLGANALSIALAVDYALAGRNIGLFAPTFEATIAPATLDYKIVLSSTPNGLEGAFWEAANQPERGYAVQTRSPTLGRR